LAQIHFIERDRFAGLMNLAGPTLSILDLGVDPVLWTPNAGPGGSRKEST
jgi:hypothetical protein